jgi:transposase
VSTWPIASLPIACLIRSSQQTFCTATKGMIATPVRRKIESKGAAPNIPPKVNRRWKNCFSPYLYRQRNVIERMFSRLKDFRRIATRYDRLAHNFLAAVCLAATVSYWL